jgi:hypothetical protein
MSFPHLGKNNLEKLEIFRFLVEIQEKKNSNFSQNPQVQLPHKIIENPAYYTILGLWKLNEVPFETYLGVGNVLDEHAKQIEKVQSSSPFNVKRVIVN